VSIIDFGFFFLRDSDPSDDDIVDHFKPSILFRLCRCRLPYLELTLTVAVGPPRPLLRQVVFKGSNPFSEAVFRWAFLARVADFQIAGQEIDKERTFI
jgi:hypothetical protein